MRAKHVLIGVLSYLAGAALMVTLTLVVTGGGGLLSIMSAADLVVVLMGAVAVGIAALTLQQLEYDRPSAASRGEGARPRTEKRFLSDEGLSWGSLAAVAGAAVGFAITPAVSAEEAHVEQARGSFEELVIDGDRDGVSVRLEHDHAREYLSERACGRCHHLNHPGQEATSCAACHRSMTAETDIFDHGYHLDRLGGNAGCVECHPDPDVGRTREEVRPCSDCHDSSGDHALYVMVGEGSTIPMGRGVAPSYVDAMHGVCIGCHRETGGEEITGCPTCHPRGGVEEGRGD